MFTQTYDENSVQEIVSTSPVANASEAYASQLLQLVRSAPLLVGTVVGHKMQEHVRQNIQLATKAILDKHSFLTLTGRLAS